MKQSQNQSDIALAIMLHQQGIHTFCVNNENKLNQ